MRSRRQPRPPELSRFKSTHINVSAIRRSARRVARRIPPMEIPRGTLAPVGAPAGIVKLIWNTPVDSVGALPE